MSGGDVIEQLESAFPKRSTDGVAEVVVSIVPENCNDDLALLRSRLTLARSLLTAAAVIPGSIWTSVAICLEAVAATRG